MGLPNELRNETITDPNTVMENLEYLDTKTDGLTEANMDAGTQFPVTMLATQYQDVLVTLSVRQAELGAGWPGANVVVAVAPIPSGSSEESYVVTDMAWYCQDTGAGTGVFDVIAGYIDAAGAIAGSTAITGNVTIANSGGGAGSVNDGRADIANVSLTNSANNPLHLFLRGVTAEAGTLAGGNTYNSLAVTLRLRRKHQSA